MRRQQILRRTGNGRRRSRPFAAIGVAGALLALAGCSRDAFDPTLPFTIPATYEANKSTRTPAVSRWWHRFGSTELDGYMTSAADDNFDIAVAVAQLEESEAQADIARAALFPTLTYSDSNQRTQGSGTLVPGITTKPHLGSSFFKEINASYILDVWGQNRDLLRAALHNRDASAYQVQVVRLTTLAAVADDYLSYAASLERVSVARENLRDAERVLRVIRDRVSAQTASNLDLSQQQTLYETQRVQVPTLQLAAEQSRTALALLLGLPPQGFHPRVKSLSGLRLPRVAGGLPSSLLVRRPDIRQIEELMLADDANVDAARKAFLPTISLSGAAGYQSTALSTLLNPHSAIWNVAAGLTQPIFEGGKLRAELRLNEAQRQQLLETYRKSIVSALTDVENALIAIRQDEQRLLAQQAAVRAARQAFDLSEQRLNAGTIDLTTLLSVQQTLFTAQDSLIQIRLARLQAVVSLFQAIGGDWDDR